MLVGQELYPLLDPAALPDTWEGIRQAHVRPAFDIFCAGRKLNVALDPYDKDKAAHLARTDPVRIEVWDFRCFDPDCKIRVFGRFTEFNVFVP
jgi:hypothetical protein